MKLLHIDLETSPNLAHVWSLWDQNVSLNQLMESTEMLCFAAKWHGAKQVQFFSSFHDGKDTMVDKAWSLLDEADVVCHYYGKRFDVPHLNREFLEAGLTPPSPYKQIDLKEAVAKRFKFPSNKLQYVSTKLGLEGKVSHTGHSLWVRCMAGDAKAWAEMRRYNKQDVVLLEQLHDKLLPWIPNYPTVTLYSGTTEPACNVCGSVELVKQGLTHTQTSSFQRYKCSACSSWSRGGKAIARVDVRQVTQ